MDPSALLDHLRIDIGRIDDAAGQSDLDAPVAALDGDLDALLRHVTGVYRFATAQLRAGPGAEIVAVDRHSPESDSRRAFDVAAEDLLDALAGTDPDEHRPNWAGAPTARWYFRRMAHETAIHRWDAESAIGEARPIDAELAVDGIDELCDVFVPFSGARGVTGQGESLHLHATDEGVEGEWLFTFTPEGMEVRREHAKGDAALRGTASNLCLFVWNRVATGDGRFEVFGDPAVVALWRAKVTI